jgi:hypothetical protein
MVFEPRSRGMPPHSPSERIDSLLWRDAPCVSTSKGKFRCRKTRSQAPIGFKPIKACSDHASRDLRSLATRPDFLDLASFSSGQIGHLWTPAAADQAHLILRDKSLERDK